MPGPVRVGRSDRIDAEPGRDGLYRILVAEVEHEQRFGMRQGSAVAAARGYCNWIGALCGRTTREMPVAELTATLVLSAAIARPLPPTHAATRTGAGRASMLRAGAAIRDPLSGSPQTREKRTDDESQLPPSYWSTNA